MEEVSATNIIMKYIQRKKRAMGRPAKTTGEKVLPHTCLWSGHNCFGAVLYPITMADFTIADVTDAMLDGVAGIACPWLALFNLRLLSRIHCWFPKHIRRESWQDERCALQRWSMLSKRLLVFTFTYAVCSMLFGLHEHALFIKCVLDRCVLSVGCASRAVKSSRGARCHSQEVSPCPPEAEYQCVCI